MTGLLQTNSCMAKVSVRVRRVWVRVRVSVSVRVRARVSVNVRVRARVRVSAPDELSCTAKPVIASIARRPGQG